MIFSAVFSFDEQTVFPGLNALIPAVARSFHHPVCDPEDVDGQGARKQSGGGHRRYQL